MNEDTNRNTTQPGQEQDKESPDLIAELREMGQQFEAVFRAAVESERAKQLRRDLASGARELSSQVQATLKSLQGNPRVQQAEERGRQVLQQVQQSKVVHDIQDTLISGISELNERLRQLAAQLEESRKSQPTNTSQQVPVEHEPPTTGETTKLDQ